MENLEDTAHGGAIIKTSQILRHLFVHPSQVPPYWFPEFQKAGFVVTP